MNKEIKKLKDQLFKQKKDYEMRINNIKRKHKFDIERYKQDCYLKDQDNCRIRKEIEKIKRKLKKNDLENSLILKPSGKIFNSKKKSLKYKGSSARNNREIQSNEKDIRKKSLHRRSKARGNSSHRSKSRDKTSESWVKRNKHLIKSKDRGQAKLRLNSSGIPLYRNKSVSKTSEKDSKKRLIVNLEYPDQWNPEDASSASIPQNLSKSISLDNQKVGEIAWNPSCHSEHLNSSYKNDYKEKPTGSGLEGEDAQNVANPYEKESETYKSFLELIKQRTLNEGNEIRIED